MSSLTFASYSYDLDDGTKVQIEASNYGYGILSVIHQTAKGEKIEVIYEKKHPAA
jgi:hypothetical protein